jgi:two-component system response regulator CpxR
VVTQLLSEYLKAESLTTTSVHDGETGITAALNQSFDIIVLDLILPKKNGFEVIKAIRVHLQTPIIILSSRHEEIDRIIGLEIGADEFIAKPCNPHEFISRLRAILRRTKKQPQLRSIIEYAHIVVDGTARQASVSGIPLDLTNTEFNILEMLIRSPGQAFSKEELTEYALGRKFTAYDRSIDVHISNLRNKLGTNELNEPWLTTVRGFGYMFNPKSS